MAENNRDNNPDFDTLCKDADDGTELRNMRDNLTSPHSEDGMIELLDETVAAAFKAGYDQAVQDFEDNAEDGASGG